MQTTIGKPDYKDRNGEISIAYYWLQRDDTIIR